MRDLDRFSKIEVAGEVILPVIAAISAEALCKSLLAKHDIGNVQAGQFYSLKKYLLLLYEINDRMPTVLKNIGIKSHETAILPPSLTSFEQFLMTLNQIYYMNHRGCSEGEIGYYKFEKLADNEYLMVVTNPYPCIVNQGIFLGIASKFGLEIHLTHQDDSCRSKGDPLCNFHIQVIK